MGRASVSKRRVAPFPGRQICDERRALKGFMEFGCQARSTAWARTTCMMCCHGCSDRLLQIEISCSPPKPSIASIPHWLRDFNMGLASPRSRRVELSPGTRVACSTSCRIVLSRYHSRNVQLSCILRMLLCYWSPCYATRGRGHRTRVHAAGWFRELDGKFDGVSNLDYHGPARGYHRVCVQAA